MIIDIYTKGVLTIIAITLAILCFQNLIPNAIAGNGYQKVIICDAGGDCADVVKDSGELRTYADTH